MAINFSNAPKSNESTVAPGIYRGVVIAAAMKAPKDPTKKEYLTVDIDLYNYDGEKVGRLFDKFFDSPNEKLQFKTVRFCETLGINLQGEVELADIAKLVKPNSQLVCNTTATDDGQWYEVSPFKGHDCYWPVEQFGELLGYDGLPFGEPASEPAVAPVETAPTQTKY